MRYPVVPHPNAAILVQIELYGTPPLVLSLPGYVRRGGQSDDVDALVGFSRTQPPEAPPRTLRRVIALVQPRGWVHGVGLRQDAATVLARVHI